MNCPVNPAAAHQGVVGCVDNGIDGLFGDIAELEGDLHSIQPNAGEIAESRCDEFGGLGRSKPRRRAMLVHRLEGQPAKE